MHAQSNTVDFSCTCGQQFRARIDQGGKNRTCPTCGVIVTIPKVAIGSSATAQKIDPVPSVGARFLRVPSSVGHLLSLLMAAWLTFAILLFIVSWFSTVMKYLALALFLGATGATIQQLWKMLRARQQVLDRKDVPILWGFVRLIAWDPIQGILILKNKSVSFSDDNLHDAQGGVRFLYPILGEELVLRVPLEVQTLRFADSKILTKEYLSVSVHGTMKWRIVDIRKFYLLVSRELRSTNDVRGAVTLKQPSTPSAHESAEVMLNSAIEWMRVIAEEQTRTVVARAKSGLLIAERLNQEMPEVNSSSEIAVPPGQRRSASEWGGATEGLASAIHDTIAQRLEGYGIAVEDVSLQEIRLPDEIVQECIAAAKAYYLPMRAQREASFKYANRQAELSAEVELLGRDNVGTRDIVGAAPAFTLTEFLGHFLHKRMNTGTGAADATLGLLAGQIAAGAQTSQPATSQLTDTEKTARPS